MDVAFVLSSQEVFKMGDVDKDGSIDFKEFLNYCVEHEKKLRLVFQAMDTNKDGKEGECPNTPSYPPNQITPPPPPKLSP